MLAMKLFIVAGMITILLAGCVPIPQYKTLETELEETRTNRDRTVNDLELKLKQAEEKIYLMKIELRNSQASKDQFAKDSMEMQAQNAYLKKINQHLSENNKALRQELYKKKSVIELQGKVIQLLDDTKKTIETSLKDQIAAQEIELVEEADTLKVIFIDKILFDSGSAEINDRGKELLLIMADSLKDYKEQKILVEGHTDDVPLSASLQKRFPSNWELSTARAAAVARFLQEKAGIKPERLSVRGYSFYRPVAPNNTEEGRRQNRRIEIILGGDK
ncbi:MAG: OmpA family protein [Desulfobacterales bacterium]|nr:MAG: OmpA family protein [Desulfobacterales bacterium]